DCPWGSRYRSLSLREARKTLDLEVASFGDGEVLYSEYDTYELATGQHLRRFALKTPLPRMMPNSIGMPPLFPPSSSISRKPGEKHIRSGRDRSPPSPPPTPSPFDRPTLT